MALSYHICGLNDPVSWPALEIVLNILADIEKPYIFAGTFTYGQHKPLCTDLVSGLNLSANRSGTNAFELHYIYQNLQYLKQICKTARDRLRNGAFHRSSITAAHQIQVSTLAT